MNDIFYFSTDEDDDTVNAPPLANSENETPGLVVAAAFNSSISTPTINNGRVELPPYPVPIIPPTYTVTRNDEYVPEPDVDGWVMTLYQPMLSWNGGSDIVSFRQLMRIKDNVLEVSWQYQQVEDGQGLPWALLI